jgi:beta-fructofuranosidase
LSLDWQNRGEEGGIFAINASGPLGPFDTRAAYRLTGPDLYAGRLVHMRNGEWVLLAFVDRDETGAFAGVICDPLPVGWNEDGRLAILT